MPWELTIRHKKDLPLGDRDEVIQLISATVPEVEWFEEPPLLEQIKDFPDHPFHELVPTWPEEVRARFSRPKLFGHFERDRLTVRLYGFEAEVISSIAAEVRGDGNPIAFLRELCVPNNWIAVDDANGQQVELTADVATGWQAFQDYKNRAISDIKSSDED